ncbi:hypothetical protein [Helicobacter cetorum]|uniref:hypothetical protein n=1 Tax=Helicobacter cetorum TaxID=138563 RepID=UPI000CF17778|nr:hypothetical protein [Helicobacter cetorum]
MSYVKVVSAVAPMVIESGVGFVGQYLKYRTESKNIKLERHKVDKQAKIMLASLKEDTKRFGKQCHAFEKHSKDRKQEHLSNLAFWKGQLKKSSSIEERSKIMEMVFNLQCMALSNVESKVLDELLKASKSTPVALSDAKKLLSK